jgi:Kef-type K+ transport system membrane component KefB
VRGTADTRPGRGGLTAYYVLLGVVTAVVIAIALAAGEGRHAQPSIAGGWQVEGRAPCLGRGFDLIQSGKYVNLEGGGAEAKLEFAHGTLSGDVSCATGPEAPLEAKVAGERFAGTIGGREVRGELVSEPPAPGQRRPRAPDSVNGEYDLAPASACLGDELVIEGGGSAVELSAGDRPAGGARYRDGVLVGRVRCSDGSRRTLAGEAADRKIGLTLTGAAGGQAERVVATERREPGSLVASFFVAAAVVMMVARVFGILAAAIHQPRVMGEVVAGIALGPTVFGALAPDLQAAVFPSDVVPYIGVVAQLGLIFYMFMVGLELDPGQLRGRVAQVAAISNTSVALPMMLGVAVAVPIYDKVAPDVDFSGFAIFMGVAMSVTAFPVLARILVERRMLKRPVGALALAAAAVDDVTAWFLIALASAVAVAGSGSDVAVTIALAIAFCLFMGLLVRPLLARMSTAYDEAGRVPGGWIVAIFAGILLSAFATEEIGIALIFGAFVMGLIMPRHAELTEDVTHRIEDFVVTLLLPLFFAYTGLRTDIGLLDRPSLWLLATLLLIVAVVGKLVGAAVAARLTGFDWRSSTVIGVLMNTRGLTELIVLNLALELGMISSALFSALVLMALITTFMAGPLLRRLDPRNQLGAPVEEELIEARNMSKAEFPAAPVPDESILVAPQSDGALTQLTALAEPLARSHPPRELILARLVRPPRGAAVRGGLQTENRLLGEAAEAVNAARRELIENGVAARAVTFVSPDPGKDLVRLADSDEVALLFVDGRRPLLRGGVPRGDVGTVLHETQCDVAVLVAKEGENVLPGIGDAVVVPFGAAEHDWAALEVGAWIASATGAPLNLLGAAGQSDDRTRVSRLLGDAGLLVQQYAGVATEPVVAEPGRQGIVDAASGAGLLVIGLSERWREEGLGPTRSDISRAAPAPVLFVRRGARPGALAPRENVTRFGWSAVGAEGGLGPGESLR